MVIPTKYIIYTNDTYAQKPCQDYWSKQETNPMGAEMLKGKQTNQYETRNWKLYICKITKHFQMSKWKI